MRISQVEEEDEEDLVVADLGDVDADVLTDWETDSDGCQDTSEDATPDGEETTTLACVSCVSESIVLQNYPPAAAPPSPLNSVTPTRSPNYGPAQAPSKPASPLSLVAECKVAPCSPDLAPPSPSSSKGGKGKNKAKRDPQEQGDEWVIVE